MEKSVDSLPLLIPEAHQRFAIEEITAVAQVRRAAMNLAMWGNFSEEDAGKVGIVVSELATNIVKHAGRGEILLRMRHGANASSCVEIVALDTGAGIANLADSMRDGMSTAGTAGNGLGAMQRLAAEFDVYSRVGQGSAFYLCLWSGTAPAVATPSLQFGAVSLPKSGEESCGDAWYCDVRGDTALIAMADGLGHGPDAATAARAVLSVCAEEDITAPARLLDLAHQRARSTRGAAAAFATSKLHSLDLKGHGFKGHGIEGHGIEGHELKDRELTDFELNNFELNKQAGTLRYAGIGNITGSICDEHSKRHLISHHGIVGHTPRKAREMTAEWDANAAIVLHSDGISSQWNLAAYPGLLQCHAALIAAVLYRDFVRKTDDATILVIKRLAPISSAATHD